MRDFDAELRISGFEHLQREFAGDFLAEAVLGFNHGPIGAGVEITLINLTLPSFW